MLSRANIASLKEKNYQYIIGARIKNSTDEIAQKILNLKLCEDGQNTLIKKDDGDNLIITYTEKRAKKEMAMLKEIPEPELIGPKDAPVTFVSWGSTINVTQEAVLMAKGQANAIHLACLKPFPAAAFSKCWNRSIS